VERITVDALHSSYNLSLGSDDQEGRRCFNTIPGHAQGTVDRSPQRRKMTAMYMLNRQVIVNFVIIGTDHGLQSSDLGYEALIDAFLRQQQLPPLTAIAEEWHETLGETVAQRLAKKHGRGWFNMDMTDEEKKAAGIWDDQQQHPRQSCRVNSDDLREAFWVEKLLCGGSGTTLAICGYLHFESLARKLCDRECEVVRRVYLESVPKIEFLG
jgi:hypothetical protein